MKTYSKIWKEAKGMIFLKEILEILGLSSVLKDYLDTHSQTSYEQ